MSTSRTLTALCAAGATALLAGCGSSGSSATTPATAAVTLVSQAFTNYGAVPVAHLRISATTGTFDIDATRDAFSGSFATGGTQYGIIYVNGHGYIQPSSGTAYTQLADADSRPFSFFTVGKLSSCMRSILGRHGTGGLDRGATTTTTTVDGQQVTDVRATDGSGDLAVSSPSTPLPVRLNLASGGSSSSPAPDDPSCDTGSGGSSDSGALSIDWSYPATAPTITPPPVTGAVGIDTGSSTDTASTSAPITAST